MKNQREPDFARLRKALLREGEPDFVPLFEGTIYSGHKEAFLGYPIRSIADEVAFCMRAGYDYVLIDVGLRLLVRGRYSQSAIKTGETERIWANEGHGLIQSEADLEIVNWPNPTDLEHFSALAEVSDLLPPQMAIIVRIGYIFTVSWMLMGLENFCISLVRRSRLVEKVMERVGQIQYSFFSHVLKHFPRVGAFMMPDDIAYNTALMVAPRYLRHLLFPWYERIVADCHQRSIPIIYHSDGQLYKVLDDILACGFDALHPIEPEAMDIVTLKRCIGRRLCLLGNVDVGSVLTLGTPAEVREAVQMLLREVAPGGGYGVGSSNSVPDYVPYENYDAMRTASLELGKYPIRV